MIFLKGFGEMVKMAYLALSFPGLNELQSLWREIDTQINHFKSATNLDCPPGCARCCRTFSGKIEVSIFEMLPLSIYLWQRGEAEIFLEKIKVADQGSPCVLLRTELSAQDKGGCQFYDFRPLVCRLFGYSATFDKRGKPAMVLCQALKMKDPLLEGRLNQEIRNGMNVPILSSCCRKPAWMNPHLGKDRTSINEALRQALEWVGFHLELEKEKRKNNTCSQQLSNRMWQ